MDGAPRRPSKIGSSARNGSRAELSFYTDTSSAWDLAQSRGIRSAAYRSARGWYAWHSMPCLRIESWSPGRIKLRQRRRLWSAVRFFVLVGTARSRRPRRCFEPGPVGSLFSSRLATCRGPSLAESSSRLGRPLVALRTISGRASSRLATCVADHLWPASSRLATCRGPSLAGLEPAGHLSRTISDRASSRLTTRHGPGPGLEPDWPLVEDRLDRASRTKVEPLVGRARRVVPAYSPVPREPCSHAPSEGAARSFTLTMSLGHV